jgi:tRNA threonylcarbamoyl adenosine modification protein (Sua5/YciO/YrdC/YwlC family)
MRVLSKNDVIREKKKVLADINAGAVFIYPTDTIYGIGCDATNDASVRRIREMKARDKKPFSVIAPGIDWINENCSPPDKAKALLLKLPGPYTLILPLENSGAVCAHANMGMKTIGVRIPDHWISELVAELNKPVITTSVNLSGQSPAFELSALEKFGADFIIYEGEKRGKPSTVIDLTQNGRVIQRQ